MSSHSHLSDDLLTLIHQARARISDYKKIIEEDRAEAEAYRGFNRERPTEATDPVQFLKDSLETYRLLDKWSATSERKREAVKAARNALNAVYERFLKEVDLPSELPMRFKIIVESGKEYFVYAKDSDEAGEKFGAQVNLGNVKPAAVVKIEPSDEPWSAPVLVDRAPGDTPTK